MQIFGNNTLCVKVLDLMTLLVICNIAIVLDLFVLASLSELCSIMYGHHRRKSMFIHTTSNN